MIAIPSPLFPSADSRRLRVGIVTETYGPEVNGVAMTVGRMVEGLLARGHSVQLIRPRQHPRDDPRRDGLLDVWPVAGAAIPFYRDLRVGFPASRLLLERWRRTPPDVVHIVTEGPLGGSALAVARRLRLRVFSGFHTNFHAYSRHYGMGLLARPIVAYLRHFHNRTDCTLVPTEELAAELRTMGFHRLRVLARGVDTRLFDPVRRDPALRRSWGANQADPVALYVGRLAAEKNLRLALTAYRALRAIRPATRLVLVGDGPLTARLQARHPEIVFAGTRTGADLATHYASADLFLFPSLTETFGNVTLEAMASGLAVVAFDYAAAHRHIVHGQSGLLAPRGDQTAFIESAGHLASDPTLRRALGQSARQAVLAFDWERICQQLERWYLDSAYEEQNP
ncbi:MAG: glycosyltransferase family 1 protein [Candidatus Competibacter sp.]|nr:glycosyltransferase family 1 protein [Candidatus Competibacter sp.]MDG4585048.1 glycosyltransferase family 1 protein [Candidatus Competibacter sp.]